MEIVLIYAVADNGVIGADGALTGFGGGLPTKRFLLELEGALPPVSVDLFG